MTLDEFKAIVIAVDPNAMHYDSAYQKGAAYTVWREGRTLDTMANGQHQGARKFYIDRYTKTENDAIAASFFVALEENDRIAFSHETDFEPDTRYIHHIFDCEGI